MLHLRGAKTPQPLEDESGNILLWNGEIFGGLQVKEDENDTLVLLEKLSNHPSDVPPSQHILSTLAKIHGPWAFLYWQVSEQKLWFGRDYFGRRSLLWHLPSNPDDVLAIASVTERNSVAAGTDLHFEEIPADGLYCLDFVSSTTEQDEKQYFRINKYEWTIPGEEIERKGLLNCPVTPFNKQMPTEEDLKIIEENRRKIHSCLNVQDEGRKKPKDIPMKESKGTLQGENYLENFNEELPVAILPPDTVETRNETEGTAFKPEYSNVNCDHEMTVREKSVRDCTWNMKVNGSSTNGTLLDSSYRKNSSESPCGYDSSCYPVGLGCTGNERNLCLENYSKDDTQTDLNEECANFSSTLTIAEECHHSNLLRTRNEWDSCYGESRDKFIAVLGDAVRKRVWNLPRTSCDRHLVASVSSSGRSVEAGSLENSEVHDARVGILFSGGIDSMMIAALADKYVPVEEAIDLINVSFEQKVNSSHPPNKKTRQGKQTKKNATEVKHSRNFSVPDRLTGISGLEELRLINPSRKWNFIEVNVTLEELQEMRSRHISHLVSPLNTVLDDSIGCALWFAARGVGRLRTTSGNSNLKQDSEANVEDETYTSRAKVLLVGMGADEQLGGYARHRTRFNVEGWSGLMDEMEMEVKRISKRNLGRDDRCISDHGREARFPFLDEDVVSFLNSLPVWLKTDPGLPRGTGEKQLLRQAARLLGLTSSSKLPKRAIQFGSRIAKLESSGEKGSETCSRFES